MEPPEMVLMVCMDRSGSNVLNAIVNQHPSVYVTPALPLYEQVHAVRGLYDNLGDDSVWASLLQDMVALTNANHRPLPRMDLTVEEVQRAACRRGRSIGAVVQAIYEIQMHARGATVGGVKFGPSWDKVGPFLETTTWTSAVLQWRDPRDVYLSVRRAGVNPATPQAFATYWLRWHREARALLSSHGIPTLETTYERLLRAPEDTLDEVYRHIGVSPFPDAVARFHTDEDQRRAASASYMWSNLAEPLMSDNTEKFYRAWNHADVLEFEGALGEGLAEFGYAPAAADRFQSADRVPTPRVLTDADRSFHRPQERVVAAIAARHRAMTHAAE